MKQSAIMILVLSTLLCNFAYAELHDDEPMFHRTAMWYLSEIKQRKDIWEDGFHFGGFFGYQNQLYWRDWFISDEELNLHLGAFVQFKGFRFEGYGNWSDPFDQKEYDIAPPVYWDANLSYLFIIENAQMLIGIRRNNFSGLKNHDTELGLPNYLDEVFLKIMAYPDKIQSGAEGSNLIYFLNVHQRIYGNNGNLPKDIAHGDGTLVELGLQTVSQNAWQFADVISFTSSATWNQRYLMPYGRFASYRFSLRLIKDISNVTSPGYGPWWVQLSLIWLGSFSDRVNDEFLLCISVICTSK